MPWPAAVDVPYCGIYLLDAERGACAPGGRGAGGSQALVEYLDP